MVISSPLGAIVEAVAEGANRDGRWLHRRVDRPRTPPAGIGFDPAAVTQGPWKRCSSEGTSEERDDLTEGIIDVLGHPVGLDVGAPSMPCSVLAVVPVALSNASAVLYLESAAQPLLMVADGTREVGPRVFMVSR